MVWLTEIGLFEILWPWSGLILNREKKEPCVIFVLPLQGMGMEVYEDEAGKASRVNQATCSPGRMAKPGPPFLECAHGYCSTG